MGMKEDNNEVTLKTRILSLELLQVILRIIFYFMCMLLWIDAYIQKQLILLNNLKVLFKLIS